MDTSIGFPISTIIVFSVIALVAIIVDLYSHRADKPISLRDASLWSVFWIAISLAFAGYLYYEHGSAVASLFITGYALEKVLSVDNLFLFMAIFSWFAVPDAYRHRVLYWGIIGAIVFRLIFVAIGTSLLAFGPWVEIVFAAVVAWTAVAMLKGGGDDDAIEDYSGHIAYRAVQRLMPVWPKLYGHNFFVTGKEVDAELAKPENSGLQLARKGKLFATPLLLCLAVVEVSDVMFAFDSVPAVIAVSREPLIVYSAMIFAILGLRTMYFVLEALKRYLVHLEKAVVAILFFISLKLVLNATDHLFHTGVTIHPNTSLVIVLAVLGMGVAASFIWPEKPEEAEKPEEITT